MTLVAACSCGVVTATTNASPLRVGACHCLDCQQRLGAPFYAAAIFKSRDVTIEGPIETDAMGWGNCATCGTVVLAQSGDETELLLSGLGPDHGLIPSYELWTIRRQKGLRPIPRAVQFPRNS